MEIKAQGKGRKHGWGTLVDQPLDGVAVNKNGEIEFKAAGTDKNDTANYDYVVTLSASDAEKIAKIYPSIEWELRCRQLEAKVIEMEKSVRKDVFTEIDEIKELPELATNFQKKQNNSFQVLVGSKSSSHYVLKK